MTANQLKEQLNTHISKLVLREGNSVEWFRIHVTHDRWIKAKYSCTEDEKDFQFVSGKVYYKGFELVKA